MMRRGLILAGLLLGIAMGVGRSWAAPAEPPAASADRHIRAAPAGAGEKPEDHDLPHGDKPKGSMGANHPFDHDLRNPRVLTPEQVQAAVEILKEQNPELAARVEEAYKKEPNRVKGMLAMQWPRLARLVELKSKDPKLFDLTMDELHSTRKTMELARQLHEAKIAGDASKVAALEGQIKEALGKQFDLRQRLRQSVIEHLQRRIAELRQQMDAHGKDEFIQKRLNEMRNHSAPLPPDKDDKPME